MKEKVENETKRKNVTEMKCNTGSCGLTMPHASARTHTHKHTIKSPSPQDVTVDTSPWPTSEACSRQLRERGQRMEDGPPTHLRRSPLPCRFLKHCQRDTTEACARGEARDRERERKKQQLRILFEATWLPSAKPVFLV